MSEGARYNDAGLLEYVDENGETIIQKPRKSEDGVIRKPVKIPANNLHQVLTPDGKLVWAVKGVNPYDLPKTHYPFNEVTMDVICMRVTEGATITELGEEDGFPPAHVMYRWVRKYKEFGKNLIQARKDRAHYFADQVIDIANQTTKKGEVPVNQLKINANKWAAEKGNSSEYGNSTTVKGDKDNPVTFVIDTGIRREIEEKEPIEVESV